MLAVVCMMFVLSPLGACFIPAWHAAHPLPRRHAARHTGLRRLRGHRAKRHRLRRGEPDGPRLHARHQRTFEAIDTVVAGIKAKIIVVDFHAEVTSE